MRRISTSSVLVAAGLAVAGGAFGGATPAEALTSITRVHHTPFYDRATVRRAAAGGMPTVIHGSPAAGATPAQIAAALALPAGIDPHARFDALPPETPPEGLRLVLVFNPAGVLDGDAACAGAQDLAARPGGALRAFAAMCAGGHAFARAQVSDSTVAGLGPDFTAAMRQLFLAMFPRRSPVLDSDRHGIPGP